MVVGKMMRNWSPWPPKDRNKKRKYQVKVAVTGLEGVMLPLLAGGEGGKVAVRMRCKSPPGSRKRKGVDVVTGDGAVRANGMDVEFGRKDNGFEFVCYESDLDSASDCEVSFSVSVLQAKHHEGKVKKEMKMDEIGTMSINITDWLQAFRPPKQNGVAEGKKSQLQVQRKQLPITLDKDGLRTEATLLVTISFEEMRSPEKASEAPIPIANEENKEEDATTDDSSTFDSEDLQLSKLLVIADEEEKASRTASASSGSASSSPEQRIGSVSKRRFLPWGRRSKAARKSHDGNERGSGEIHPSPNSSPSKETARSIQEEDPIGSWENKEFTSRDHQTKLKSQTFFASIDQRDNSAGGESACTALVAVIADALHSQKSYTPTRSEFDALIKKGSSEWQKLCNDASYIDRFPNKHFDLDTILEAKIRPISVLHDKSFVGFFQPESFESLRGAMSFDDIWTEISSDVGEEPRIYIVSWNDHFFVLKAELDAYYIIDTLGERLFEGCDKAYILKFDESTEMYRVVENNEEDGDEVLCRGKECCREFIKRFLAAIPLREELEVEEKGTGNANTALHQRLQIEFHLTAALQEIVVDDIDWW